jgi:hypothetical protein
MKSSGNRGVLSMPQLSNTQREQIEMLAYLLWEERGGPLGSPEDDWFRAEEEFIERSDSPSQLPFLSPIMEPLELE